MHVFDHSQTLFYYIVPVAGILFLQWLKGLSKRLPPGPPQIPVLGNIHQVPNEYQYYRLTEWAKLYGTSYLRLRVKGCVRFTRI